MRCIFVVEIGEIVLPYTYQRMQEKMARALLGLAKLGPVQSPFTGLWDRPTNRYELSVAAVQKPTYIVESSKRLAGWATESKSVERPSLKLPDWRANKIPNNWRQRVDKPKQRVEGQEAETRTPRGRRKISMTDHTKSVGCSNGNQNQDGFPQGHSETSKLIEKQDSYLSYRDSVISLSPLDLLWNFRFEKRSAGNLGLSPYLRPGQFKR